MRALRPAATLCGVLAVVLIVAHAFACDNDGPECPGWGPSQCGLPGVPDKCPCMCGGGGGGGSRTVKFDVIYSGQMVPTGTSDIFRAYWQNAWPNIGDNGVAGYDQTWSHVWYDQEQEVSSACASTRKEYNFKLSYSSDGWADSPGTSASQKKDVMIKLMWGAISRAYDANKRTVWLDADYSASPVSVGVGPPQWIPHCSARNAATASEIPQAVLVQCTFEDGGTCGNLKAEFSTVNGDTSGGGCGKIGTVMGAGISIAGFLGGFTPAGAIAATLSIMCNMF